MAAAQTGNTYISACKLDRNTIPNPKSMFSTTGFSIVIFWTLCHVTVSRSTRWRPPKPEIHIYQLVHEKETPFYYLTTSLPALPLLTLQWRLAFFIIVTESNNLAAWDAGKSCNEPWTCNEVIIGLAMTKQVGLCLKMKCSSRKPCKITLWFKMCFR